MAERQDRRLKLQDEIRRRLRKICSNLDEDDFEELVKKIAENAIKSDIRPARHSLMSQIDLSSR